MTETTETASEEGSAEVAAEDAAATARETARATAHETARATAHETTRDAAKEAVHGAVEEAVGDAVDYAEASARDAGEAATAARRSAVDARADAASAAESAAEAHDVVDPLLDPEVRQREAGVDEDNPFGRPGRPLSRRSPFFLGLFGALGVATAYLLVEAVIGAQQVLVLLLIALFLALGLDPSVSALERRGLSRGASIGIVFLVVILFFLAFVAAIVPLIVHQATTLTKQLPDYLTQLQHNATVAKLDRRLHFLAKAQDYVRRPDFGTKAFGGFVGIGRVVLSTTLSALTVLILTLYLLGSLPTIKETAYRLMPRSRRARVQLLGDEILGKVGGYVAGALTIAAIAGGSALAFLLVTRAPYPLALAMLIAITDLIPLIGATVGAVAVTVICLFASIPLGIASLIFFVAYQQLENYLIYPRVMGRTVDVSPAATIIAALIGGALLGILGALLAIPLAAAISLILREVVMPRQDRA